MPMIIDKLCKFHFLLNCKSFFEDGSSENPSSFLKLLFQLCTFPKYCRKSANEPFSYFRKGKQTIYHHLWKLRWWMDQMISHCTWYNRPSQSSHSHWSHCFQSPTPLSIPFQILVFWKFHRCYKRSWINYRQHFAPYLYILWSLFLSLQFTPWKSNCKFLNHIGW